MPYDTNDPRSQLGGTTHGGATRRWGISAAVLRVRRPRAGRRLGRGHEVVARAQPDAVRRVLGRRGRRHAHARAANPTSTWCSSRRPMRRPRRPPARESEAISGKAVVVMPPGDSELAIASGGQVVRLFSTQAADLVARCRNAEVYRAPRSERGRVAAVARSAQWTSHPRVPARRDRAGHRAVRPPAAAAARSWSTTSIRTTGRAIRTSCQPSPPRRLRADLAAARG